MSNKGREILVSEAGSSRCPVREGRPCLTAASVLCLDPSFLCRTPHFNDYLLVLCVIYPSQKGAINRQSLSLCTVEALVRWATVTAGERLNY